MTNHVVRIDLSYFQIHLKRQIIELVAVGSNFQIQECTITVNGICENLEMIKQLHAPRLTTYELAMLREFIWQS